MRLSFSLLLTILLLLSVSSCGGPKTSELQTLFIKNKSDFVEMKEIFHSLFNRHLSLNKIGHKRLSELMKKNNVQYINPRSKAKEQSYIEFIIYSSGMATGGSSMGIAWSIKPKIHTVANLQKVIENERDYFKYQKIEGNWYLFAAHDG